MLRKRVVYRWMMLLDVVVFTLLIYFCVPGDPRARDAGESAKKGAKLGATLA